MRIHRSSAWKATSFTVAAVAAALIATPLLVATPARAGVYATPTISDFVMTGPTSVTLTGTQTTSVTVSVRIVSPDGQFSSACYMGDCNVYDHVPQLIVARPFGGAWPTSTRPLTRISGSDTDGVWQAKITLTADDAPGISVTSVGVGIVPEVAGAYFDVPTAPLGVNTHVNVKGINPPVIAYSTTPSSAPDSWHGTVTANVTLMLRDTRTPLAGRALYRCDDLVVCGGSGIQAAKRWTTDARGKATIVVPYRDRSNFPTVYFYRANSGPAIDDVLFTKTWVSLPYRYRVSGYATPNPISTGAVASLQGNVNWPDVASSDGRDIYVQRWVSGSWKTLGRAHVRASGRWSYVTRPPARGTYAYRAFKPSDRCDRTHCVFIGGISPTFTLTVR